MNGARPNRVHEAVTRWMQHVPGTYLITQNVDSLHLKSGAQLQSTIELHGRLRDVRELMDGIWFRIRPRLMISRDLRSFVYPVVGLSIEIYISKSLNISIRSGRNFVNSRLNDRNSPNAQTVTWTRGHWTHRNSSTHTVHTVQQVHISRGMWISRNTCIDRMNFLNMSIDDGLGPSFEPC